MSDISSIGYYLQTRLDPREPLLMLRSKSDLEVSPENNAVGWNVTVMNRQIYNNECILKWWY